MSSTTIVYSKEYQDACCLSPKFKNRYALIMELIRSYDLMKKLHTISPSLNLNTSDLISFHSSDYLSALSSLDEMAQRNDDLTDELESFGFAYDCPGFPGVLAYSTAAVAGTLAAADSLLDGTAKIAINWGGGWHHAKRNEASGFCYLNDIVYGILKLRERYSRVLYIDIDLHHGDGVEESFANTPNVMTFSMHHLSCGFFPGTGAATSVGFGKGKYSAINLPFDEGLDDGAFISTFRQAFFAIRTTFKPQAIVLQCGADALASDPHRCFNLSLKSYILAVANVIACQLPTLILGGGGYNFADTAKLWTAITALTTMNSGDVIKLILSNNPVEYLPISSDIPEHKFWRFYGPDFDLSITLSLRPNLNVKEKIYHSIENCFNVLKCYQHQKIETEKLLETKSEAPKRELYENCFVDCSSAKRQKT